jgi:hypothetical protein
MSIRSTVKVVQKAGLFVQAPESGFDGRPVDQAAPWWVWAVEKWLTDWTGASLLCQVSLLDV